MEIGIYANIFRVKIDDPQLHLLARSRSHYPSLRGLRAEIRGCRVYAVSDIVYGYGGDIGILVQRGFQHQEIAPSTIPQLTSRLILEGFSDRLETLGYRVEYGKYRNQAFDVQNPRTFTVPHVLLYEGCSFNSLFLRPPGEELVFGLIVDLKYRLEIENNPASYHEIRRFVGQNYDILTGETIIRQIRVMTGDLTPSGRRNSEAVRLRHERIMNIVRRVGQTFDLPTGNKAFLTSDMMRVVLEV